MHKSLMSAGVVSVDPHYAACHFTICIHLLPFSFEMPKSDKHALKRKSSTTSNYSYSCSGYLRGCYDTIEMIDLCI